MQRCFGQSEVTKMVEQDRELDKIEIKSNYKGEFQADVRIGGLLANKELIDDCIDRQKYVWERLKEKFPNIKIKDNIFDDKKE